MKIRCLLMTSCIALSVPAFAQYTADPRSDSSVQLAQASTETKLTEGEVRRIDKDAQKLTIRHGPILNLDMPPMTMVFQVKDPAMLDRVNTGDKIRFRVERIDGVYTVTYMEPAP